MSLKEIKNRTSKETISCKEMDVFIEEKICSFEPLHKIEFVIYSPNSLATVNNNNSNIFISLPKDDDLIYLQKSYFSLELEVFKKNCTRYADNDQIIPVNFGPNCWLLLYLLKLN